MLSKTWPAEPLQTCTTLLVSAKEVRCRPQRRREGFWGGGGGGGGWGCVSIRCTGPGAQAQNIGIAPPAANTAAASTLCNACLQLGCREQRSMPRHWLYSSPFSGRCHRLEHLRLPPHSHMQHSTQSSLRLAWTQKGSQGSAAAASSPACCLPDAGVQAAQNAAKPQALSQPQGHSRSA